MAFGFSSITIEDPCDLIIQQLVYHLMIDCTLVGCDTMIGSCHVYVMLSNRNGCVMINQPLHKLLNDLMKMKAFPNILWCTLTPLLSDPILLREMNE
jgi:hypothetical protein